MRREGRRQNGAARIGRHGIRRWGRHDRGLPCPVGPMRNSANLSPCGRRARPHKSHIACAARAPPYAERCNDCSGKACWKERTPNIPIRKSDERAPDHREPESCCRRHKLMTASRCNRVQSSNSISPAVTGRSARSTRSQPSLAAYPLHRVIAIARIICEWRVILSFKYHRRRCSVS
jgi:hypothetical protein